jgi:GDP-D-mannose dehydratase
VPYLRGNSEKIRKQLGWEPSVSWQEMLVEMLQYDLYLATKEANDLKQAELAHSKI